jgi:hypothetical protein
MPKNVEIEDVDDATYATLHARAEAADLSLAQYLRKALEQMANVPTMAEWLDRMDEKRRRHGGVSREAIDRALEESRAERR